MVLDLGPLNATAQLAQQAEEDKVSLDEQRQDIETYAASKGYTIVKWYSDVGSGASKRRPQFQQMLRDIQAGEVEVIIAWKSDRLSRGLYPATALMEAIEGTEVTIEAVKDMVDLNTFGLLAAVGKIEIDNFRERSTLGKRGVVKRGKVPVGSIAYGYRIGTDGRPEIDPNEGPIVQAVFQKYVHQGIGVTSIARELTEEAIPMRRGGRWSAWSPYHPTVFALAIFASRSGLSR